MIFFDGVGYFTEEGQRAVNWCLYNFVEPVIDLMDIFHLNPNNQAEMLAELGDYFPEYLIRENPRLCIDTLIDLASWMQDGFPHTMTVVHEYALFNILFHECNTIEESEGGNEFLKRHFAYPEMNEVPPEECACLENMGEFGFDFIVDNIFRDTDFLMVDRIATWELANCPFNEMLGIDIEYLAPLLPKDVRERIESIFKDNEVYQIFSAVRAVLDGLEGRPALLEDKSEEEINAQIASNLEHRLNSVGLGVFQESPFGYSPTGTGEVDFYVYDKSFALKPKAIGEAKVWNKFRKSLDQLMGYMNEGIDLGFTITINKTHNLQTVMKKQKEILENYSIDLDDFRVLEVGESKLGGWLCAHKHPENGQMFLTNHFTLNLYHPARKKAASSRGKKKKS